MGEGLGGVLAGFAAGSRVGGYLLEEQVGAGGMAVVFRARDERLRRVVALKVLGPGLAADEDFRRRFIRESRAAAAVEDPHIIPVHEAGRGRRGAVHRDAVRVRRGRADAAAPGRPAAGGAGRGDHLPGGLGAGFGACGGAGAPGREAGEHAAGCAAGAARSCVSVGFRAEQGDAVARADRDRAFPGDAGVRGAGADPGQAGGWAGGSVCAGVHGVRVAVRFGAVPA